MSTISSEQVRELLSLAEQKAGSLRDAHALLYKFADYAEVVAALCREWLANRKSED